MMPSQIYITLTVANPQTEWTEEGFWVCNVWLFFFFPFGDSVVSIAHLYLHALFPCPCLSVPAPPMIF